MARRLELQEKLENILGSTNVYYQPPESVKLKYPCIIYERYAGNVKFANNKPYNFTRAYQLMVITDDPDETYGEDLLNEFSMIHYSNHFVKDNLNHEVYVLYF